MAIRVVKKHKHPYTIQKSDRVVNARYWPLRSDGGLVHPKALRSSTRAVRASGLSFTNRRMVSSRPLPACSLQLFDRFLALSWQSFCAINSCSAEAMFIRVSEVALSAIVRVRQHLVQTLVQTETSTSFEPCFSGVSTPPLIVRDAEVEGSNPFAPIYKARCQ